MYRTLMTVAGFSFASIGYGAEPKEELITRTYDVANLLQREGKNGLADLFQLDGRTSVDDINEIGKLVVGAINPKSWLLSPDGGNRLYVVNRTRLEIKASKDDHDEITRLLEVLRLLSDLAIDVKATFYAVDAKWFDKEIRPQLGKELPSPINEKSLVHLRKNAEVVEASKTRFGNRRYSAVASLYQSFAFIKPEPGNNGQPVYGVERVGVEYRLKPIVIGDRRFVQLEIDEITRIQQEPKKNDLTPTVKEKKTSSAVKVGDGEPLLFVSLYTPQSLKDKGRILILAVEPRIYIEAEEKELRGKKDDG